MKKNLPNCTFVFFLFTLYICLAGLAFPNTLYAKKAYIVPIEGTVDPGMAAFIKRTVENAVDDDSIVILELDTFGGQVDSALHIVDTMLELPKERTIAYVKKKAISAGALIALSCGKLIMKHNTTIGDCAPITYSKEGPKMMGEKFQSPIRAKFRALAKRNGYPEKLAQAMVSVDMVVYQIKTKDKTEYMSEREYDELSENAKKEITSKTTIVAKGELLTMDDVEAVDLGFSKMSVSSIDEMLAKLDQGNFEKVFIQETWSETLVRFIGTIAPILMLIGLAAIYLEIKSPGFGVPGIIGIICLGLYFLNQYMVGLADYTELLIIVIGIVLLAIEVFVLPGFGIAGVSGILCIAIGMILAMQDFVIPDPNLPWQQDIFVHNILQIVITITASFLLSLAFFRFVIPKISKVIPGPYLFATLKESQVVTKESMSVSPGDRGFAKSMLRPSGKAQIDNDLYDVITEGEYIENGSKIMVTQIKGNRIIVSKESENE